MTHANPHQPSSPAGRQAALVPRSARPTDTVGVTSSSAAPSRRPTSSQLAPRRCSAAARQRHRATCPAPDRGVTSQRRATRSIAGASKGRTLSRGATSPSSGMRVSPWRRFGPSSWRPAPLRPSVGLTLLTSACYRVSHRHLNRTTTSVRAAAALLRGPVAGSEPLRAFSSMSAAARDESRPVEVPAVAMPEADAQGDLFGSALLTWSTPRLPSTRPAPPG
jgi:hypothetical protein